MTTRHNAWMAVAILLAVSTAQSATIFVDAANCRPPASDCCTAHGGPGCDDLICETAVCTTDPACCLIWDSLCVRFAEVLCDPLCRGACPGGGGSGTELDPFCCIQEGIDAAINGDDIVVAPGTYFESIDFLGKAITVRSTDPTDAGVVMATILNGGGVGGVVTCNSGEGSNTVLLGFVITNGNATFGGGMRNANSSPTVTNCTFSGNFASTGGGMSNSNSSPTVTNCTFSRNSAATFGGGMFNNNSSPTVTNCTFSDNAADAGGGMLNFSSSSPTVTNCTFSDNAADAGGGGMSNTANCSPTVTNCTFSGNTADSGGGMNNHGNSPTLTNCTFSENSATDGGGMYNANGSSPTLTNCTFSENSATNGGGIYNVNASSLTVTNCILWNNGLDEIFGPATVAYSNVQGGFPGTGNIDADPLFVDPVNGDFRLLPGSPCIDAADNIAVPDGIDTDLDGNPRFVDDPDTPDCPQAPGTCGDPPVVDMGAYEFQAALPCPWDCDGGESTDGTVGITDFLLLLAQWGGPGSCDFDGGGVGITDFLALLGNWGPCP